MNLKSILKTDLLQSAISFAIKLGSGIAAYALFAIIARLSSPEEFGRFSILFSIAILVGIMGSLGLQVFMVKEQPKAHEQKDLATEAGLYKFGRLCLMWTAPITALIFTGVALWSVDGMTGPLTTFGVLLTLLYATSQATIGMLRVQEKTLFAIATRDLLWRVIAIVLFAAAVTLTDFDRAVIAIAALGLALLPVVISHCVLISQHTGKKFAAVTPELKKKAWIDTTAGLGLVAVISSADFYLYTIVLGILLSATDAGVFFAALKTAELLNMFLMAVTLIMSPKLSAMVAAKNRDGLQTQCNVNLVLQAIPLLPACLVLFVAAPYIMSIFDPNYAQYGNLLRMLGAVMLLNAMTGATVLLMQVGGMHWRQVCYQGGSLALSLAIMPWLVTAYGVYGAAIGFAIAKLLWNITAIIAIRKKLGVDPSLVGFIDKPSGGLSSAITALISQFKPR